jgi:hypothetical protein
MGWDDYEYEIEAELTLDRGISAMDGPKLTRGFSFHLMDKDEIE